MKKLKSGGGWQAIRYTFRKAHEAGGLWKLWKAMRSRNACKTCAVGMGGQAGGMVNEAGHFPEVCKKSLQAMVSDMQGGIPPEFFATYSVAECNASRRASSSIAAPDAADVASPRRKLLSTDFLG